jgi:MFS family permease
MVILGTRTIIGEAAFADWGWRIPFIVSIFLLAVSVWIRLSMNESPAFQKMKAEGKTSKAPISEAFGNWKNLKIVLLALFGLVAGQAVVWYSGQFYALFFLTSVLKVDGSTANILVAVSLIIGTPFFVVFGSLSDKIGRKPIIMAGLLLAILTYFPLFEKLTLAANPALAEAQTKNKITVTAAAGDCSFQGNPVAREIDFTKSCDIAKRFLAQNSVSYDNLVAAQPGPAVVKIGDKEIVAPTAAVANSKFDEASLKAIGAFKKEVAETLKAAGYPPKADPAKVDKVTIVIILSILVIYVTMVYGPIAAMLVEMFPTRIRYTSMSLPYHIGNGWFGGLMPTIAFAMVAQNGNMYYGLWYPIVIAAMTLIIGMLFVRETKDVDIYAEE